MTNIKRMRKIMTENKKKKRINSKKKGGNAELEIVHILRDHFNNQDFARVGVSSGARTKNSKLPVESLEFYSGDIITPSKFLYSVEVKCGYSDVSITTINKTIDSFIEQVEQDARISNKLPLILFKQNRKPWLAMIKEEYKRCQSYVKYKDYYIYDLKELFEKKENWFEE